MDLVSEAGTPDADRVATVARYQVPCRCRRAANQRVGGAARCVYSVAGVAQIHGASEIGTDVVALDGVAVATVNVDRVIEAIDDQPFDGAIVRGDVQSSETAAVVKLLVQRQSRRVWYRLTNCPTAARSGAVVPLM